MITHPDSEHYAGFETILGSRYSFDVIYHSGLMERPVGGTFEKVGGLSEVDGREYLAELLDDRDSVEAVFDRDPCSPTMPDRITSRAKAVRSTGR